MTDEPKTWPSLERVKELEQDIRPTPTVGPNGTVTVNRDTAIDIADTLDKVRDQIESEIDRDPKPTTYMRAFGVDEEIVLSPSYDIVDGVAGPVRDNRALVEDAAPFKPFTTRHTFTHDSVVPEVRETEKIEYLAPKDIGLRVGDQVDVGGGYQANVVEITEDHVILSSPHAIHIPSGGVVEARGVRLGADGFESEPVVVDGPLPFGFTEEITVNLHDIPDVVDAERAKEIAEKALAARRRTKG